MLNGKKQRGFSLAEVLMALAILAVGMAFIAGVFPAGIYYTIISTERTLGSVVADEAFAKIRLYGVDVNLPSAGEKLPKAGCADFLDTSAKQINPDEFAYPSDPNINIDKQYYWSALCKRVSGTKPGESMVQVTVFVSRKTGFGTNYYDPTNIANGVGYPRPVSVTVEAIGPVPTKTLKIIDSNPIDNIDERTFINAGSIIVEDTVGRIYRVVERNSATPDEITIERAWQWPVGSTGTIWVIPPPVGGGRQPCIGVFQREMLF